MPKGFGGAGVSEPEIGPAPGGSTLQPVGTATPTDCPAWLPASLPDGHRTGSTPTPGVIWRVPLSAAGESGEEVAEDRDVVDLVRLDHLPGDRRPTVVGADLSPWANRGRHPTGIDEPGDGCHVPHHAEPPATPLHPTPPCPRTVRPGSHPTVLDRRRTARSRAATRSGPRPPGSRGCRAGSGTSRRATERHPDPGEG